jgi:hypothetical protein
MKHLIASLVALGVIAAPAAATTKANPATTSTKVPKKNAKLARKPAAHAHVAAKTN